MADWEYGGGEQHKQQGQTHSSGRAQVPHCSDTAFRRRGKKGEMADWEYGGESSTNNGAILTTQGECKFSIVAAPLSAA